MRVRTLALYLIGDRQAILEIAADRRYLWVGLLFVLSAGFAREYDGQDLLHEPWHLLIPVAASLAASFLLFLVACGGLYLKRDVRPPFFTAYRAFLTLFWMTAPLAWLYAIPYERFLSPAMAVSANLGTLALVATWRVAIMLRVVSAITGRGVVPSLFLVMAFADSVAMTAIYLMPKPIVSLMGGIRLTESELVISNATFLVSLAGILSAPIWGIGGMIAFFTGQPKWSVPDSPTEAVSSRRGIWVLAALSLAIWLPILPWTQVEQQLRSRVEDDLKAGRIADALEVMSVHSQSEFPPQWDPPPRVGYGEKSPHILQVIDVLLDQNPAPWVRASYMDKFKREIGNGYAFHGYTNDELATLVRILKRLPDGPDIAAGYRDDVESRLSREVPAAERENLNAILKLPDQEEIRSLHAHFPAPPDEERWFGEKYPQIKSGMTEKEVDALCGNTSFATDLPAGRELLYLDKTGPDKPLKAPAWRIKTYDLPGANEYDWYINVYFDRNGRVVGKALGEWLK